MRQTRQAARLGLGLLKGGGVGNSLTRHDTTMTVMLRPLLSLSCLRCTRRKVVPTAAHQCIPDTAPAKTTEQPNLFHQVLVQAARKTKKRDRAMMEAAMAMMPAPMMLMVAYVQW